MSENHSYGNEYRREDSYQDQENYSNVPYTDDVCESEHGAEQTYYSGGQNPHNNDTYVVNEAENDKNRPRSRNSDDRRESRRCRSPSSNYQRRSRSRSRSRSHRRSRQSRSRSRSRGRHQSPYDRRRSRSRSRSREDRWESNARRSKRYEAPPNHTIIVKGLPLFCEESIIWDIMGRQGYVPKDIRIVKSRETGQSRGFGFVEFSDVDEAYRWMLFTKACLKLDDGTEVDLEYSFNKFAPGSAGPSSAASVLSGSGLDPSRGGDWNCSKCNTNNFKKRGVCFKCNIRREESEAIASDGFHEIGVMPCDTLLLRNVPMIADEQRVLMCINKLTSLEVRRVVVARNSETRMSRGFIYVEMSGVTDAAQLLTTLTAVTKLIIDGKEVFVSYSKYPLEAVLNGANMASDNDQTLPLNSVNTYSDTRMASSNVIQSDVTNAAAAVAQNAMKKAQVMRQVVAGRMPTIQASAANTVSLVSMLTSGGAIVLAPAPSNLLQQQVAAAQALHEIAAARFLHDHAVAVGASTAAVAADQHFQTGTVQTPHGELPKYPPPDVSTFQYESSSGFYYDSTTGLYYDAKTLYYYNSEMQQYLYWDGNYQTYLPAPCGDSPLETSTNTVTTADADSETAVLCEKKAGKQDKVKIAKKIQQDMEKWAKQCQKNHKGTKSAAVPQADTTAVRETRSSGAADAAFSVLEKTSRLDSGLVSYETGDSDEETNVGSTNGSRISNVSSSESFSLSSQDVDFDKLACLLCRRQFPSREVLLKHQQFSDLHKKNLDAKNRSQFTSKQIVMPLDDLSSSGGQYRDRAKERREKFGDDDMPIQNKLKEKYLTALDSGPPEQPTASGIKSDNVGNKLLKSMGWQEGQGLGRQNHGIVDPISEKMRVQGAGLGAPGSRMDNNYSNSYKDQLRAVLRQKFLDSQ